MLAHYMRSLPMLQYKRLFEFSVGLLESYYIACDWLLRCIDPPRSCVQDTSGFLSAVTGRLPVPAGLQFPPCSLLATFLFTGE